MAKYKADYKTFERKGKTGTIFYYVQFQNGVPVYASSSYKKEDGLGGVEECHRTLAPDGPTVRKLLRGSQTREKGNA